MEPSVRQRRNKRDADIANPAAARYDRAEVLLLVYKGTYRNGIVVLDGKPDLPEGAAVEVSAVPPRQSSDEAQPQASSDSLEEFIGMAGDLPPDFAEEHDHYLHGTPKRRR